MSTTPTSDPEKKKVDVFDEDDAVLAQLGYTQGKWCVGGSIVSTNPFFQS